MTAIISIILFIGGLGSGIAFPILPALGEKLGVSSLIIGMILSSDKIARLIFNLPAGQLFPRLGIRRMLGGAMAGSTLGLLCFSFAMKSSTPALWLFIGRLIYGTGASFLIVGAQSAVLELTNEKDRGRKMASVRLAVNSAIPGGLVLGGLVSDLYSDFAAFLVGAAITLGGTLMAVILLPGRDEKRAGRHMRQGPAPGFRAMFALPDTPGLFSVLILNFLVFLTVQGALLSTLVLFLQQKDLFLGRLGGQGSSGLIMAVMVSCAALSSFFAGQILDRLPSRSQLMFPALTVMLLGFIFLSQASSIALVLTAAVLIGLTYNNLTIPLTAFIGDRVKSSDQSRVIGLLQLFGDFGGMIGPILGITTASRIGVGNLYLFIAFICLCCMPAVIKLSLTERKAPVLG